jgi:hypothetical protein
MASQEGSPAEHYTEAERLIRGTAEIPANAPALALAHALLTPAPRRAHRVRHARHAPGNGLPPHRHWGDQQTG